MNNKLTILIVEDEAEVLEYYTDFVSDLDFNVSGHLHPSSAIEELKHNSNRIIGIISDYNMEDINGIEFRQSILEKYSHIPFILLSGELSPKLSQEAMANQICLAMDKIEAVTELPDQIEKYFKTRIGIILDEIEMSQSFVKETYPMLSEIEDLILDLEDRPEDEDIYKKYCRLLHTIKGTAACVGLNIIAEFAHTYEDYIVKITKDEIQVNEQTISVLLAGFDRIKYLFDQTIAGNETRDFIVEEEIIIFNVIEDTTQNKDIQKKKKKTEKKEKVEKKSNREEESINVQLTMLDEFLSISGELTVIRNYYVKALSVLSQRYTEDKDIHYLNENLEEMQKYSGLLQNQITNLRKVPLSSTLKPLKRIVRDASKSLGKKISFHIQGEELLVDTSISKLLSNCLVHIIRNSVDHGIESTQKRIENGKSEEGKIELSIQELDEVVTVEIVDDGGGINPEIIKNKAIEKELYSVEEIESMDISRVLLIIFESGFSTAEVVSDISGRGVGMDMVKSSIEEFNGKIDIESVLGDGTKFTFTIPLPKSVKIVKSLTVNCGKSPFSIAEDDIFEVISLKKDNPNKQFSRLSGSAVVSYYGNLIPYINLSSVLSSTTEEDNYSRKPFSVIIQFEESKIAFGVDSINEIEEVVVRKVAPMGDHKIYMGATLLGDRSISLIFDMKGLIAHLITQNIYEKINEISHHALNKKNFEMKQMIDSHIMTFKLKNDQVYALPLKEVYRLEKLIFPQ